LLVDTFSHNIFIVQDHTIRDITILEIKPNGELLSSVRNWCNILIACSTLH